MARLLSSKLRSVEQIERKVDLDLPVGSDKAFGLVVQFLYKKAYAIIKDNDCGANCVLHALAYILADRLLMESMKIYAVERMRKELAESYNTAQPTWALFADGVTSADKITPKTVQKIVMLLYNTDEDLSTWDENDIAEDGPVSSRKGFLSTPRLH